MSNPETTLTARLAQALRECSDDLEAELRHRYGADAAESPYATERSRYLRDMKPVRAAQELLAEWENQHEHS